MGGLFDSYVYQAWASNRSALRDAGVYCDPDGCRVCFANRCWSLEEVPDHVAWGVIQRTWARVAEKRRGALILDHRVSCDEPFFIARARYYPRVIYAITECPPQICRISSRDGVKCCIEGEECAKDYAQRVFANHGMVCCALGRLMYKQPDPPPDVEETLKARTVQEYLEQLRERRWIAWSWLLGYVVYSETPVESLDGRRVYVREDGSWYLHPLDAGDAAAKLAMELGLQDNVVSIYAELRQYGRLLRDALHPVVVANLVHYGYAVATSKYLWLC